MDELIENVAQFAADHTGFVAARLQLVARRLPAFAQPSFQGQAYAARTAPYPPPSEGE